MSACHKCEHFYVSLGLLEQPYIGGAPGAIGCNAWEPGNRKVYWDFDASSSEEEIREALSWGDDCKHFQSVEKP